MGRPAFNPKYQYDFLHPLDSVKKTIRPNPSTPHTVFPFHLLGIAEVRVRRQEPYDDKQTFRLTPGNSLERFEDIRINV